MIILANLSFQNISELYKTYGSKSYRDKHPKEPDEELSWKRSGEDIQYQVLFKHFIIYEFIILQYHSF